jgi:hypothetical protein
MPKPRLSWPSPSMAVALVALALAATGAAVAAIPGPDGAIHACVANGAQIGVGSPVTPYAVPKGNLRVIDSDASCGAGESPLVIGAPENPVTRDAPVVFASRSRRGKRVRGKLTPITSNAVVEGQYLVTGAVRVTHPDGLEQDQSNARCWARTARCCRHRPSTRPLNGAPTPATSRSPSARWWTTSPQARSPSRARRSRCRRRRRESRGGAGRADRRPRRGGQLARRRLGQRRTGPGKGPGQRLRQLDQHRRAPQPHVREHLRQRLSREVSRVPFAPRSARRTGTGPPRSRPTSDVGCLPAQIPRRAAGGA